MKNLINKVLTSIKKCGIVLINIIKKILKSIFNVLPNKPFWQKYLKKLFSLTISLKIYMLSLTTYLLMIGKIGEGVWSTVFLGIALGRIVEKKIYADNETAINVNTIDDVTPLVEHRGE